MTYPNGTTPRSGRRRHEPHRRLSRGIALVLGPVAGLVLAPVARADQLVVRGTNFPGARVETLEHGQLLFRTLEGKLRTVWLSDVDTLIIDRRGMFVDFNQAERYLAGGEAQQAVIRYRRTLRRSEPFWRDLIVARLVTASDRAGQLEMACQNFALTVRSESTGPALAVRLLPRNIPAEPTDGTAKAVDHLEAASAAAGSPEQRLPLALLRYEILRRTGDERATTMAPRIATLPIPEDLRTEGSFEIVTAALAQAATESVDDDWWGGLDRAIRDCPAATLPDLLLLKGEVLLQTASTQEDTLHAGWPFMRVAIHMPDDPRAAKGLLGAAQVVERIGRTDKAIELLEECLAHSTLTDETRKAAQKALAKLRPGGAASP